MVILRGWLRSRRENIMSDFWSLFWFGIEIFLFFAYLIVLFNIVADLFRDTSTKGWVKAIWIFFLILVPLITALVYLIVRGGGMAERRVEQLRESEERGKEYIREVAGTSAAQEIATAKGLLDAGTITQAEFDTLKAKALAG